MARKKRPAGHHEEVQFKGDFKGFFALYLKTDPQFYASSPKALLTQAREISKRLDAQLPRFFKTFHASPTVTAPVPDAVAPKYTEDVIFPRCSTEPILGAIGLTPIICPVAPYICCQPNAHEAVPGHHLQMALNADHQKPSHNSVITSTCRPTGGWGYIPKK